MNSKNSEPHSASVASQNNQDHAANDLRKEGSNKHASAPSSLSGQNPSVL